MATNARHIPGPHLATLPTVLAETQYSISLHLVLSSLVSYHTLPLKSDWEIKERRVTVTRSANLCQTLSGGIYFALSFEENVLLTSIIIETPNLDRNVG